MKVLSFKRFHFGDKVKWDEMFDSVEELIESVKSIDVDSYENKGCKGFLFIKGFQKTLSSGGQLTHKQVSHLKRLSKEVYKYHMNL